MEIGRNFNPWDIFRFGFGYINTIQKQRAVANSQSQPVVSNDHDESLHTMRNAIRMRRALEAIRPIMLEPAEISLASPASAISISDLGLDMETTSATIQSTEEVNTTPTSYSTHGPEWTGDSTAQVTISGEYDGSNGTDMLRFEVTKGGTIGGNRALQIRLYDSNNTAIETINIKRNESPGTQYTLNNGLVLTFSDGDLTENDNFTVQVYDSVGTAVNPDNPFNGVRNENPDLEEGLSVTSGSFQINGVNIAVQENDTINTVLDRINQADAGVTASFDAATEKVVLTQNTPGEGHDIVLDSDTSGFLAAVKLDGAAVTPGKTSGTESALAEVGRFSSVQSDTISVNGVSIDIDVNADSLTDVLDRITASVAGVTASFDSATQRVSLVSDNTNNQLVIDSGTTNFFPALEISDGTYDAENDVLQASGVSIAEISGALVESVIAETTDRGDQEFRAREVNAVDAEMLGTLVHVIANSMNALFDDTVLRSSPSTMLEDFRKEIRSAVSATFDSEGPQFNTDVGIQFDFQNTREKVFSFSEADQHRLATALTTPEGQASVSNLFFGSGSNGLLNRLHAILSSAEYRLTEEIGSNSIFLDTRA
jgi:hypothetical protein